MVRTSLGLSQPLPSKPGRLARFSLVGDIFNINPKIESFDASYDSCFSHILAKKLVAPHCSGLSRQCVCIFHNHQFSSHTYLRIHNVTPLTLYSPSSTAPETMRGLSGIVRSFKEKLNPSRQIEMLIGSRPIWYPAMSGAYIVTDPGPSMLSGEEQQVYCRRQRCAKAVRDWVVLKEGVARQCYNAKEFARRIKGDVYNLGLNKRWVPRVVHEGIDLLDEALEGIGAAKMACADVVEVVEGSCLTETNHLYAVRGE
jgi:hypothetical protein